MTKIMLVEDDNNLREIYEARLKAEGFEIVTAPDGEAALAVAAKERPDLVITDVMMPKISGFEMLDILRNTEGLRNVKVIMLTALGQAEDSARADALGADRYLVKSQVTLEDIIKAAHDVVEGDTQASNQAVAAATGETPTTVPVSAESPAAPPTPTEVPVAAAPAEPAAVTDVPMASAPDEPAQPEATPPSAPETAVPAEPQDVAEPPVETPPEAPAPSLTLPPVADDTEPAAPAAPAPAPEPAPQPAVIEAAAPAAAAEESTMRSQIDQFLKTAEQVPDNSAPAAPADSGTPQSDAPAADVPAPQSDDSADADQTQAGEEDSTEIAQDDAAPDLGQFAIHPPENPPAAAESPQPTPDQAQDDKVVSTAINDMLATTGTEELPTTEPPAGIAPLTPVEAPASSMHGGGGSLSSRVLQPLASDKPDINQLLSVEDAKTSASQAAASTQPPAQPPAQPPTPPQPQTPPPAPSPHNPNGVDPNSIAL